LPSPAQKNQPELLGNHRQNHQLEVADQADQADLAADDHRVDRVGLVADPDPAKSGTIQTNRIFNLGYLPLSFSYGEMRNSHE
jgi:hypothetical protein